MMRWLVEAIAIVLAVLAVALLVPALVLFMQVLAARRPVARTGTDLGPRAPATIVMPAHDEAAGIAAAITCLLPQLQPGDRLLVVADNCSDATAAIARSMGAEVTERTNLEQRGKGYALDHGIRYLEAGEAPGVVVIVDADCEVHVGTIDRLVRECTGAGRPVQALYLMRSPPGAAIKTRIAEFAWIVRNQVRPLGCLRLGLPCQLMGTGMAFPWHLIVGTALASGHIVEDMQLGLDLAAAGAPPLFCSETLVTSVFPQTDAALDAQRTRWEHGHLGMIASRAWPMLRRGLVQRSRPLVAMALDLCVPPLASLTLSITVAWVCSVMLLIAGRIAVPFVLSTLALLLVVCSTSIAWRRFARHVVPFSDLTSIPAYVWAKLPIYARLLTRRQVEWVRTKRGDPGD